MSEYEEKQLIEMVDKILNMPSSLQREMLIVAFKGVYSDGWNDALHRGSDE